MSLESHPCLTPIISFEIWRMRLPWAHIHTFSSPDEPQGQFWTNLLQKGGISAAEAWVVRQLQHLPCLRSPAALAFLGFQLFLVNLLVGLAWLFFPFASSGELFPLQYPHYSSGSSQASSTPCAGCPGSAGGSLPREGEGSVPVAHWRSLSPRCFWSSSADKAGLRAPCLLRAGWEAGSLWDLQGCTLACPVFCCSSLYDLRSS